MNTNSEFFVKDLVHEQESRFCTYTNVNIYATTFNVNGRSPPDYLGNWLNFDTTNLPDIIAIGLQEMDLALGTYVTDNAIKQHEWLFVLQRALPNVYEQIDCIRLIGIFLVLYKNRSAKFTIDNVSTSVVPTGFLKFGNKGGVGISLQLNDTSVCFINSHLAAGSGELTKRNQDYYDISQMQFANIKDKPKSIYEHDAVIWIGDLNYRLSAPLSFEEVVHMCLKGRHQELFEFDQLQDQQRKKGAFYGFRELTPVFKPTYKYDVGTNNWDSSEKRRVPAWCDRILYWARDKNVKIEQLTYKGLDAVTFSDHKPVSSTLKLTIKKIDKKKMMYICDEILKENDRQVNNLLPQVSLSQTEVHFGSIQFGKAVTSTLTIRNIGLTSTQFRFSNQHQTLKDSDITENWLTVTPKSSFIEKNAEIMVTLQACVKNEEAPRIKIRTPISCILILSLDQGRDYFVVVTATYIPPTLSSNGNASSSSLVESKPINHIGQDDEKWLIDFMFSLFEGAKKLSNLLDYIATPEANASNQVDQIDLDVAQVTEVSVNSNAIADKVLRYAKIASTVAQEKANKLSDLVSQTTLDNLNKQQKEFQQSLTTKKENDFQLPWEGLPNEAEVKSRFLELSLNTNVFLEDAPVEVDTEYGLFAEKMLQHDKNLGKLRYKLVPKKLSEKKFWQNYMYRVSLLSKIIKEESANEVTKTTENQSQTVALSVADNDDKAETQESSSESKVNEPLPEKSSPSEDDDWEKELLSAEYDVVKEEANDENWENELDNLLESCKTDK